MILLQAGDEKKLLQVASHGQRLAFLNKFVDLTILFAGG
jgi:hypothetical protein